MPSCQAIAADIIFSVQCLPLLRHVYPEHWLFSEHPTLRDLSDGELVGGAHLERWEELQWDVYCSVQEHITCFQGIILTHCLPMTPRHPCARERTSCKCAGLHILA
jgi:hypothetical protein